MNINFEYYRIFYYVARYNNFTKAAHALGSSQPNVTRAMNCLENALQCTLFVRTNRGVHLTAEGERLYTRVSAAMSLFQAAEDEMLEQAQLKRGSIVIGASETALSIYLPEKLSRFHSKYPGIQIKLYSYSTPQAVKAVKNGEVDLALVTTPVQAESLVKEIKLQKFAEKLIGGKNYSFLQKKGLSLKEIEEYPLICLGKGTMTHQFYQEIFGRYGLKLNPDVEVATTDQILSLVQYGLGIAFIPEPMAEEAVMRQEVVSITVREHIPDREICMVYDEKRPMSVAAQRFKKLLMEEGKQETSANKKS